MRRISRRKFLFDSSALAALGFMSGFISGCTKPGGPKVNADKLTKGFTLLRDNGMHLRFYFINLELEGKNLKRKESGCCYIIIQLPAQSLHEQYFISTSTDPFPKRQQKAQLSGCSFLAFKLWKNLPEDQPQQMYFSAVSLLDWTNTNVWHLQTTLDLPGKFKSYDHRGKTSKAQLPELVHPTASDIDNRAGIDKYKSLLNSFLKDYEPDKNNCFLTLFELPANLFLVPHLKTADYAEAVVIQNNYCIAKAEYDIMLEDGRARRKVTEHWNAEVLFRTLTKIGDANGEIPQKALLNMGRIPTTLRAIGFRGTKPNNDGVRTDTCNPDTLPNDTEHYIPTQLDRAELVLLTQVAGKYLNDAAFDIKAEGVFMLTSLGATAKLSYKNYETKGLPTEVSLVEYEHHFQDGRDNYIKVARIGCIAHSGQKAIHLTIAQRKIKGGVSFMEYHQYIEVVEPEKAFPEKDVFAISALPTSYISTFKSIYTPTPVTPKPQPPNQAYKTYTNKVCFSKIVSKFKRSPPIRFQLPSDTHFWVYKEDGSDEHTPENLKDKSRTALLDLPFEHYDTNGNGPLKTAHPIYFLRRDFFCSDAARADLLGYVGKPTLATLRPNTKYPTVALSELMNNDGRFRIPYNEQVVALTPDVKESITPQVTGFASSDVTRAARLQPQGLPDASTHGPDENKINRVKTDYVEYYFDIAELPANVPPGKNIFDLTSFPSFPQIRQAAVYVDCTTPQNLDRLAGLVK